MKILITGARGFVGRNLAENLKNIRDGKDRTRADIQIEEIYEYDKDTDPQLLKDWCQKADFIYHLAGVNRPTKPEEFMEGNFGFSSQLLQLLLNCNSSAPVMLASSVQASLTGRFADSAYGRSKLEGEKVFYDYATQSHNKILIYRFPNLFGKWCRPGYNSAVATFCHNVANDLPIQVNDPGTILDLVYIDDLVKEMLDALEGNEHKCSFQETRPVPQPDGKYCYVPISYQESLGTIVDMLRQFENMPKTLIMPDIPEGSFIKKLYSAYLSYLPKEKTIYDIPMSVDDRGSFNELMKSYSFGQVSINVSKPGKTKGQHWHNSKWEIFIVVSGHGLIQERKIGGEEVMNFEVTGDKLQAVQMLPGYTHNIINLSDTQDLVTVMWANEIFDSEKPETYRECI